MLPVGSVFFPGLSATPAAQGLMVISVTSECLHMAGAGAGHMSVLWPPSISAHISISLHALLRNIDHLPPHLPPGSPLIELKSPSPFKGDLVSGLTSCAIFPTLRQIISLPLGIDANRVLLCVFIILWASHLAMWILWSRAPQTSLHIGIIGELGLNGNPACIGLGWGPRAACLIRS